MNHLGQTGSWDRGFFLSPSQQLEHCFQNTDGSLLPKESLLEKLFEMVCFVFQVGGPHAKSRETNSVGGGGVLTLHPDSHDVGQVKQEDTCMPGGW